MGARADFYVGRGKDAEWLGSITWDGYPDGNPKPILAVTNERDYRNIVKEIIASEDGTTPEMGWPWPWKDSLTTDYSYAFDEGIVWGTCFGYGWWMATDQQEEAEEQTCVFPKMKTDRMALPGSSRSGVIVLSARRDSI